MVFTNPVSSVNDPAGREVLPWCCTRFAPSPWQTHLSPEKHMWYTCEDLQCQFLKKMALLLVCCKDQQTLPWVLQKPSLPTLRLEIWPHTHWYHQQTPTTHKSERQRFRYYKQDKISINYDFGLILCNVTSSVELFIGSCVLAAPLAVELPFSSFTLPKSKKCLKFYLPWLDILFI